MKKIIAFLMLIIGALSVSIPANAEKQDLRLTPTNPGKDNNKPKKPLFCPVSGYIEDGCLTLFCTSTGEVEIIMIDETGSIVYNESAVIDGEYCIFLENDINYTYIYITIGSHTFAGEL